jgi:predicted enzyme related to lactoylglutathione lyase
MRLFVELFVEDTDKSRNFYRDLIGMSVVRNSPDYIELSSGQAQISICPKAGLRKGHYLAETPEQRLGCRVEFCLEVQNLKEIYDRAIQAGAIIHEPIEKRPWGRTDFRIIDPDGAYLRITTPVE